MRATWISILALAEAAGNPLILSLIDSIVGLLREQRMRTYYTEGGPERGQYHHKRILEADRTSRSARSTRGDARASSPGTRGFARSIRALTRFCFGCCLLDGERKQMASLGFVGLGVMGSEMVLRLLEKGHTVTGYNRTRSKGRAPR